LAEIVKAMDISKTKGN